MRSEFGPWDEDVYAQRCMDHHSADKIAASDVAPDGACKADRPAGATPNSNGHSIYCSQVLPVTAHPLTEPAEYEQYLGATPVVELSPRADDGCERKFGPWDEDVCAQNGMDHHSVDKVAADNVSTDSACKADVKARAAWTTTL